MNSPIYSQLDKPTAIRRGGKVAYSHEPTNASSVALLAPVFYGRTGIAKFGDRISPWDTQYEKEQKEKAALEAEEAYQAALANITVGEAKPASIGLAIVLGALTLGGLWMLGRKS